MTTSEPQPLPVRSRLSVAALLAVLLASACSPPAPGLPDLSVLADVDMDPAARALLEERYETAQNAPTPDNLGDLGVVLFAFDFVAQADTVLTMAAAKRPQDWAYQLGTLKRQMGQLPAAQHWFEQALGATPGDLLARTRLAEVLLEQGALEPAEANLRRAVAQDSSLALARFLLGEVLMEQQRPEAALPHLQGALRLQPDASQVHAPLAAAFQALGETTAASVHRLLRGNRGISILDPRMAQINEVRQSAGSFGVIRAEALMRDGRFDEAVALLEAAVDRPDVPPNAWITLGVARVRAGSRAGALLAFRRALEIDSTLDKAHFNLGMLAMAQGDTAQAERSLAKATTVGSPNPEADAELARIFRRSGRCTEAIPHLSRALTARPESPEIRLDLVLCLSHTGQDSRAIALLEEGLAVEPNLLGYVDALARILATSRVYGDAERALTLADQAIAIEQRVETMETAALALSAVGRNADADRTLEAALRLAQRDGRSAYARYLDSLRRQMSGGNRPDRAWPDIALRR